MSFAACVEPFEIKDTPVTNLLVVEGILSDQAKKHQIMLSRTTSLSDRKLVRERGALVTITDHNGVTVSLHEESPGIYETPELAAQIGGKYVLKIKTADGSEYTSQDVLFKNGPEIGEVYARYVDNPNDEGKGVQIYVDTEDTTGQTRFYRWNYIETYEIRTPFPSVWVWIGNNSVEPRAEAIDKCYVWDTLRHVLIRHTKDFERDEIKGHRIQFVPERSHILRYKYSILVQQYALTEASYEYWENLRIVSEEQGSLSDIQPGSLMGNVFCTSNPDETVLGYFEVCKVSEKRIFVKATDFYDQGMKMPPPFRGHCLEIAPIFVPQAQLDEMVIRYQETHLIWDAFGESPNTTFELMPKACCDCRDQGTTERPAFF